MNKRNEENNIPKDHPRYQSLKYRHKIIDGMKKLIVAEAGLIAHGRGECFDYIIGEKTPPPSKKSIKAAIALLLLAKNPVISVNGNVAALIPDEIIMLSNILDIPLEINIFYRKKGRVNAITNHLKNAGASTLLGTDRTKMVRINELSSNRRNVDPEGIMKSDVVLVPLEDGDRTEALKKIGKKVIAIDLNPISRTSLWADITIVDNVIRAVPQMIKIAKNLKNYSIQDLKDIVSDFDNKQNIKDLLDHISKYIDDQKREIFNFKSN